MITLQVCTSLVSLALHHSITSQFTRTSAHRLEEALVLLDPDMLAVFDNEMECTIREVLMGEGNGVASVIMLTFTLKLGPHADTACVKLGPHADTACVKPCPHAHTACVKPPPPC